MASSPPKKQLPHATLLIAVTVAITLGVAAGGCRDEEPRPNGAQKNGSEQNGRSDTALTPETVILAVDGIEIRQKEMAELLPVLVRARPTLGKRAQRRWVLRELLQLRVAQRSFAKERRVLGDKARGIAKSLGASASVAEIEPMAARVAGGGKIKGRYRHNFPLSMQEWVFADEHIGQVSQVFETARGFVITATTDKTPGPTQPYDAVDLVMLPFYVHEKEREFLEWWTEARGELANKPATVHPDYSECLPDWVKQ